MLRGIAHVCLNVKDLDRSVAFYCDALGMKHAFDFVRDGKRYGVYLHVAGRNFIELFQREAPPSGSHPSYQHLCLEVEDINAAIATLRERGLEVTDAHFGADNSWQAWIADPDGNRIELHHYTPDSKQAEWVR